MGLRAQADDVESTARVMELVMVDGDTIPMMTLPEFSVRNRILTLNKRQQRSYDILKRRIIKTYPYAQVTKQLLENYDEELAKLDSKKDQREYLDLAETELKEEFEGEIRNMTVKEGKILMKLIDRETGDTSYELIKKLKGGFSAFMYQGVARLFGSNLKSEYDGIGEDVMMEYIVQDIEMGIIYVPPKQAVTTKAQERIKKRELRKRKREKQKNGNMSASR